METGSAEVRRARRNFWPALGGGVPDVGGVEVGEDTEDTCFLSEVHLVFGNVMTGGGDHDHGFGGGDVEFDGGDVVRLA